MLYEVITFYPPLFLRGLTGFTHDMLSNVFHTFTFVRLWRTETTDFCCHLTKHLLVMAFKRNHVLFNTRFYTFRKVVVDVMRETKLQVTNIGLNCGTVPDTIALELFCIV